MKKASEETDVAQKAKYVAMAMNLRVLNEATARSKGKGKGKGFSDKEESVITELMSNMDKLGEALENHPKAKEMDEEFNKLLKDEGIDGKQCKSQ